jgi:type IV pilus assembly protein PilM
MDNFFKDILSKFKDFNKKTENSAVGIDIGTSSIKIVEIKKKGGKAALETYGLISLGSYAELDSGRVTNLPPEKLAEALKEGLKQSGVISNSIALAMPVQSSLVFTIELPAQLKNSDLASIVPTEARKYIPVPITEVSLDWFLLPKKQLSFEEINNPDLLKDKEEKTEVLVIAIQNDAINKYQSMITTAGLDAKFFEIEIFSSTRVNLEHELSLVLIVDLGASRAKLTLVEFGIVKSFHIVPRGGADISESISKSLAIPFSEAEKMKKEFGFFGNPSEAGMVGIIQTHFNYIFSEINGVLLGYEKKHNKVVTKIIFTGGGAQIKGLKEIAENNFKAEIAIGKPFKKVETPEFLDKVLSTTGPEFGTTLGIALRKLD